MAVDDLHRLSADEYHRLIDSGGFDEDARIELIDGLLLDLSPKTPKHENAIAWHARAGVPVCWVVDVDGGRAVMHCEPVDDEYARVEIVSELTAPHIGLEPLAVADVLAAAG